MKVEFLAKFGKDLDKVTIPHIKQSVAYVITEIEKAKTLQDIHNVKKLKGTKFAYRIRIGDYRLGFYYEHNTVQLSRIVHRKDIYKVFP